MSPFRLPTRKNRNTNAARNDPQKLFRDFIRVLERLAPQRGSAPVAPNALREKA
jgi:hypothetical protein